MRCQAAIKIYQHLRYVSRKDEYIAKALAQPEERKRQYRKKYDQANRAQAVVRGRLRKRAIERAAPPWLTKEHWRQMNEFYALARKLTEETGVKHHVDHIVPLRGKTVSGLHVPWNLRVLTAEQNQRRPRVWSADTETL